MPDIWHACLAVRCSDKRASWLDLASSQADCNHMRRQGFEKVRLSDVARELGVSHVALYAHFADKAALLDAVTERWLAEVETALGTVCKTARHPVETIRAWFLELYRLNRQRKLRDPELYRAFDAAAALNKQVVVAHLATLSRQLVGLVQKANEDLEGEPQDTAMLLFAATSAFHHPRLMAEHVEENRELLLENVLDALLTGIRSNSSGGTLGRSPAAA